MPKSKSSPLGLTDRQLAQTLDVGLSTVQSWKARKIIPYRKIAGGMVRFRLEEVLDALEKFKVSPR